MKYEIIITYKCNWNCEYCAVNTHNNNISFQDTLKKIEMIPYNSEVTLSGGEVGTLSEEKILFIIDKLQQRQCVINLNTNGLFIKKYPHLLKIFKNIYYHCSENLDLNDEIIDIQCNYLLIITDKNFTNLEKFINKFNKDFILIPATTPHTGIKNAPELSRENRIKILKNLGNKINSESKINLLHGKDYSNTIFI